MTEARKRLGAEVFDLPVTEIRAAYRSAVYFHRAKTIMERERPSKVVTMQVFQKNHSVLCGMDEALAILRICSGQWIEPDKAWSFFDAYLAAHRNARMHTTPWESAQASIRHREREFGIEQQLDELWCPGWEDLEVKALWDGDEIEPWEPVLTITGPYSQFAHLESVYLGVLARRTKVASNVRRVCDAARGKPLLFFADRFDHFGNQGGDGYAAHVGGATGVATDAMGSWWGEPGMGTIPHALIAAYDGDTVAATQAFAKHYPNTKVIALVDFHNDCVGTSLACARALGDQLHGVRLDTSENMVDVSIQGTETMGDYKPTGVNPQLVENVRKGLDAEGFQHVKITVSGGFNVEKIKMFEELGAAVDAYAVGSSLFQGACDFTADIVSPAVKKGRWQRDDSRLELVQ